MIVRFTLLILLDIIFAITLFEQKLIIALIAAFAFIMYTIELAVEMESEFTEPVPVFY